MEISAWSVFRFHGFSCLAVFPPVVCLDFTYRRMNFSHLIMAGQGFSFAVSPLRSWQLRTHRWIKATGCLHSPCFLLFSHPFPLPSSLIHLYCLQLGISDWQWISWLLCSKELSIKMPLIKAIPGSYFWGKWLQSALWLSGSFLLLSHYLGTLGALLVHWECETLKDCCLKLMYYLMAQYLITFCYTNVFECTGQALVLYVQ